MFKIAVNYKQADSNAVPVSHESVVYTTSGGNITIEQPLPNIDAIYQSPAEAMAGFGNRPFYMKQVISNGIVIKSYVGFVITDAMAQSNPGVTAGTYYLNGKKTMEYVNNNWQCMSQYDDGAGNCIDPDYNTKKAILLSAFGSSNCTEYTSSFYCSISNLYANLRLNGSITVYDDSYDCTFGENGISTCGLS